jgi:hypothetical protein
MNRFPILFAGPVLALALTVNPAIAGPGHDHGDEAPAAAAGPVSPRFEAHTDLFEVVGVLEGDELSVFIDRFADNAPVLKAKVELESGSTKAVGEFHEKHGDYRFAAAPFKKPGSHPITLTVMAGDETDLLAGDLVVPDQHAEHDHEESSHLMERFGLGVLGLIALGSLGWGTRRRQKRLSTGGLK